jgi:hypothetical protein
MTVQDITAATEEPAASHQAHMMAVEPVDRAAPARRLIFSHQAAEVLEDI